MKQRRRISLALRFALFAVAAVPASAVDLPVYGCPMAHCDSKMSDQVRLPVPSGDVQQIWQRNELSGEQAGSSSGLGCSGNGLRVACTYQGAEDNLVVYDYDGNRLWSSGVLLNSMAHTSAPLVETDGSVIAADSAFIMKFNPMGALLWYASLPDGGIPISPVVTDAGVIVVATAVGPIYAFSEEGVLLDTLWVKAYETDEAFFDTRNTPSVRQNRVYVSMQQRIGETPNPNGIGWLVAIDVDPAATPVLRMEWNFEFGAPSGASPLTLGPVTVFDGDHPFPSTGEPDPFIFGVIDLGDRPYELWRRPALDVTRVSFAADPRAPASFWGSSALRTWLVRRSLFSGRILEFVNVDILVDETGFHVPTAVMNIAGNATSPIMLVAAADLTDEDGSNYVLAIDLQSKSLLWKVATPVAAGTRFPVRGQFPVLIGPSGPRVVFSSSSSGARAVGRVPAAGPNQQPNTFTGEVPDDGVAEIVRNP